MTTLFTIGHSNHPLEPLLALLRQHGVDAVADVRSQPFSRYCPHFNPPALKPALATAGIAYVYLGKELGARPDDPACYVDGRVSYERLAARPAFAEGLARVQHGMTRHRLALLCTEKDPIDCHRMILLARRLRAPDLDIQHILADGALEPNEAAEQRLAAALKIGPDLFTGPAEAIERAYDRQAERIAYRGGSFDDEREAGPPHG